MEITNKNVIWGWAAAAGAFAFLLLTLLLGYAFFAALLLSVLIAILVAILIWIGFYRDVEAEAEFSGAAPAPVAETPPAPKPEASERNVGMMGQAGAAMKASVAEVPEGNGQPVGMAAPRNGGADDLKRIKGVGPKLETLLNSMGYFHFDQIASWTEREVAWVDDNLKGFKGRVTRDNWVAQAQELAGQERA